MRAPTPSLAALFLVAGCGVPTVTRPNPPAEPAAVHDGAAYAGRIELEAPALDGYARETWSVLRRRLSLLEVPARITFDADRAIVDVYGVEPASLAALADRLADPMQPTLVAGGSSTSLRFAQVQVVGRPRPGCDCKAVVRLDLSESQLRAMSSPPSSPGSGRAWTTAGRFTPSSIANGGALTGLEVLRVLVEWEWESATLDWRPVAALVHLAPPGDDLLPHVYHLGGGSFERPVLVRAVHPRGGS